MTDKGLLPSDIEVDGKLHHCPTQTKLHKQNGAYICGDNDEAGRSKRQEALKQCESAYTAQLYHR